MNTTTNIKAHTFQTICADCGFRQTGIDNYKDASDTAKIHSIESEKCCIIFTEGER